MRTGPSSPWCRSRVAPRLVMCPSGKARRGKIPAECDREATQTAGMQRRSNAAGLAPRAARADAAGDGGALMRRLRRPGQVWPTQRGGILAPGGSMTKAALVEEVSRVADLTKKHSEVIVDTVFRSIITALRRGEKIELRGWVLRKIRHHALLTYPQGVRRQEAGEAGGLRRPLLCLPWNDSGPRGGSTT